MEAFGQCIQLAFKAQLVTLWSFCEGGENASLLFFFFFDLLLSLETSHSSCELMPSDLRHKHSSVPSDRPGSDKEQALALTSNHLYLQWLDVPLL